MHDLACTSAVDCILCLFYYFCLCWCLASVCWFVSFRFIYSWDCTAGKILKLSVANRVLTCMQMSVNFANVTDFHFSIKKRMANEDREVHRLRVSALSFTDWGFLPGFHSLIEGFCPFIHRLRVSALSFTDWGFLPGFHSLETLKLKGTVSKETRM